MAVIGVLSDFNVGLVPGEPETSVELRVFAAVCKERAVLHREEVEGQTGLDAVQVENESVIQFATDDGSRRARVLVRVSAQAIYDRRIGNQIKGYFVFLVLGRSNAAHSCRYQGTCNKFSYDSVVPELTDGIGIHFGTPHVPFSCLDEDSLEYHARLQLKTSARPADASDIPHHPLGSVGNLNGQARECP